MNSNEYREVLKNHLVDIGNSIGGLDWIFQEDNTLQTLILPNSNSKKSMFYVVHCYHLDRECVGTTCNKSL